MELIIDQVKQSNAQGRKNLERMLPAAAIQSMEHWIEPDSMESPVVVDTLLSLDEHLVAAQADQLSEKPCIINLQRLNDIRFVNKFLESANRNLPLGGYLVGSVLTSERRKEQLMAKYSRPISKIVYPFDYLIKRVWPKLPYLRRAYFALTQGRNRVLSEMETYGRLYACGFRLLDSVEADGKLYFIAEKTGEPDYNMEATYGPFIKLRRVGKNGKIVKVYKMRTMYPYSEYVQQFIYERNGAGGIGTGSKFNNDPRITTVGKFMRKYWIDELPMIYNLLRGDLKIFGVRPISKHYFSLYPADFQEYRKNFKPGLVPPVYVEIPKTLDDTVDIERRYLQRYERQPLLTDVRYLTKAFYNIFIKRVRSC
ncbi:MAG: sugar transferase [Saprospiraceae bacterium]|nr:sugar transferase [Saprospiraceae bacterium]